MWYVQRTRILVLTSLSTSPPPPPHPRDHIPSLFFPDITKDIVFIADHYFEKSMIAIMCRCFGYLYCFPSSLYLSSEIYFQLLNSLFSELLTITTYNMILCKLRQMFWYGNRAICLMSCDLSVAFLALPTVTFFQTPPVRETLQRPISFCAQ